MQLVRAVLGTAPSRQGEQEAVPENAVVESAGQLLQADSVDAPARGDAVPGRQGMQPDEVWPTAGLYEPAGQAVQLDAETAPARFEYSPAAHGEQPVELSAAA